jgi:tetratricopeptide (TPR) repeat protein
MSQSLWRRNHSAPFSLIAVLTSLLVAGPVWATGKKSNKQAREMAARAACLDGNYTEGVAILSKLFVETKDVTYIYNQGRCFEQNRRYEDAIARLQEYLRAGRKSLDANDRAEAEQHISDCKEMLAQERGMAPPAVVTQPPVVAPIPLVSQPQVAPTPEPAPVVTKPAGKPASTSGGAGLRTAGIVVASFGIASAGAGLAFNLKANSMVDNMYKTPDGYTKESDRKTWATLAWVGYGVGAACVVTGAILFAVGLKAKSSPADDVAFVPVIWPDHVGAVLAGAF